MALQNGVFSQVCDSCSMSGEPRVRKRLFLKPFICIKFIFLPRQARDKHRENSKKARFVGRAADAALVLPGTTTHLVENARHWNATQPQFYARGNFMQPQKRCIKTMITFTKRGSGQLVGTAAGKIPHKRPGFLAVFCQTCSYDLCIKCKPAGLKDAYDLLRSSILKLIILPSQARDKHRND